MYEVVFDCLTRRMGRRVTRKYVRLQGGGIINLLENDDLKDQGEDGRLELLYFLN